MPRLWVAFEFLYGFLSCFIVLKALLTASIADGIKDMQPLLEVCLRIDLDQGQPC